MTTTTRPKPLSEAENASRNYGTYSRKHADTVSGGRAIIEDVGDYPDGTELEVEIIANDEMSAEEKTKLNGVLKKSWAQAQRGEVVSGDVVLERLRARR